MAKEYSSEDILKLYDAVLNDNSEYNENCNEESSENFLQKAKEACNKFNKEFEKSYFDEF